jgi:hypothetical protein
MVFRCVKMKLKERLRMFKVTTDEEFFHKFEDMQMRIQKMSAIFQNEGTELSAIEMGDWNIIVNETKREFNKLIKEAYKRINMED